MRIDDVRRDYPELDFRHNAEWAQNNILASLLYAEDAMAEGFVSSYSDIVYTAEAVRGVVEHPGDIVLAVDRCWRERYRARTQHPESDGEKVLAEGDRILRVARDVPSEEAAGEFIGLAKLTTRGAARLREEVGRRLAAQGLQLIVDAPVVTGGRGGHGGLASSVSQNSSASWML